MGGIRKRMGAWSAGLLAAVLIAGLGSASPSSAAAEAAAPTTAVTGTITGGTATGPAIAGATIELTALDDGVPAQSTTTDAAGAYTLSDVPVLTNGYDLLVTPPSGSEYLHKEVSPVVPQAVGSTVVDLALPLGARIEGSVVQSSGASPQGATVTITRESLVVGTFTLGAEGTFAAVGLDGGDYGVTAKLPGTGDAVTTVTGVVPGETYPVHLTLLSPGVVSGTVTSSETGDPLAGITVQRQGQSATTDASGAYALTTAAVGSFPVTFTDPAGHYVTQSSPPVTVETAQTVAAVDAQLQPAAVITGTVLTTEGDPLPGVLVTSTQFDPALSGLSDYQGHYRIGGVPAGTYTLRGRPQEEPAISSHLETTGPTVTVTGGQNLDGVDFAVDEFALVSGTLTRSLPIAGDITTFTVIFFTVNKPHASVATTVRPDAAGHYETRLPPGRYLIRASASNSSSTYETTWWENVRRDWDEENPYELIGYGAKVLVVAGAAPLTVDLGIDRGNPFTTSPKPVITGTPSPGKTLTATVGAWSPSPTAVRYEWRRGGVPIEGATGLSYAVTEADLGELITIAVTGSHPVAGVATLVADSVWPIRTLDPTPRPTITGEPRAGSTLTAVTGTWGPAPVKFSYQWVRNGVVIAGETGPTYAVQPRDVQTKIVVKVTGRKTGYPDVVQSSPSVTVAVTVPTVERIAGADRYEESALISQRVAPGGSPLVYLASGEGFADALSGSAIAAQRSAPLLLSTRDSVPASVAAELGRLAPEHIVVLGGENTLSAAVVAQVEELVPGVDVHRIGGADRYAVSRNLILDPEFGAAVESSWLFIATGRTFADALSGTPGAAKLDAAVLLVDGRRTAFTEAEQSLLHDRQVNQVTILGGTASVSYGLQAQLPQLGVTTAHRIDGADRYVVSANVAKSSFSPGYYNETAYIAFGGNFPDALAGGVLAGSGSPSPLYLAQKGCLDKTIIDQIASRQPKKIVILGGPDSIAFGSFPPPVCAARG